MARRPRSDPSPSGYPEGVLRADEEELGADADDRPARYETPPPLVRPWERRAGLDHRPETGRPAPAPGDVPRWLPRRLGERIAVARVLARETRERTVGGARIVRDVADGVRDEAVRMVHDAEERAHAVATTARDRRGRPTLLVGTAVVLAACTSLLVTADPWEPSSGARGYVAWGVAVVALGLAAARPGAATTAAFRTMLLPVALLAVLAPLSRAESPLAWAMFDVPVMGVLGAVLVGAAAAGSRRAAARRPSAASVLPRAAVGVATLAVALAAWGVHTDRRVIDRTPASPAALSDRTGAFRGIEVGARLSDVRARLGTPTIVPEGDRAAGRPLDAPRDLALPAKLPDGGTWRYDGLALVVSRSRVLAVVVTDDDAQTAAGAGIGDSLEVFRRAYGGLTCGGVRRDDETNPAYPSCRSRLPGRPGLRRIAVAFSGDPVQSVVLQGRATGPLLEGTTAPRRVSRRGAR
ncbi:hypothetical protein AB0L40_15310 [Patulibacter sp. NPDC049589]|uniref:hypothetical protein n=1 Tax=Patulibacter sp. NPDC049589 TaxID=3154731 RepID=UPI003422AD05